MLHELKYKDYDKFLISNLAPKQHKNAVAAIFTFGADLAQIPTEVSEPLVGQIKFQWWRDVLAELANGLPPRPHPVLLALKGYDVDYTQLAKLTDYYEEILHNNLPQEFEQLTKFLVKTDVYLLKTAAKIMQVGLDDNIALAYVYNSLARKLLKNNNVFGQKLLQESAKLLPKSNSLLARITAKYNKNPHTKPWQLNLSLLAGNYKLL